MSTAADPIIEDTAHVDAARPRFGPAALFAAHDAADVARRFAGQTFLFRVGNAGIAFVTQIVLARWMGAHEFGIYVYVWTWVLLLGTITGLGLSSSPQYFIPSYVQRGEMNLLRGYVAAGRWLAFGLSSAIAALASLGLALAGDALTAWPVIPFYLGLACLPVMVLNQVQDGIAQSFNWPGLAMAPTFLWRPILLVLFLLAAHFLGYQPTAIVAMLAAIAASWVTALGQFVALGRRLATRVPPGPRHYRPGAWLRISFPMFLVEGFYLLLGYCDVILLERFVSAGEVGIYYAATKLVSLVAFVQFSVASATAHNFTALHVGGRSDELAAFLRASVRWTFIPSAVIAIALSLAAEPLLSLFGPGFAAGAPLLPVLLVGLLARASIGPVERFLVMVGQPGLCAAVYAAAFAVNIGAGLALIPFFGPMGAGIATSTALIAESILLFVFTKQRLGLHVFYWGGSKA
jgi:O-antigen/teichoic acid export membrane protein